jgi:PAS domain S-box-containing protein
MQEAEQRFDAADRERVELARQREEDLRKSGMLVGIMADLTSERTKLRDEMTKSKQLAAIVASSDDAIISTTFDGIVLSWNHGAEKLYGYRSEEMLGQRAQCLLPDDRVNEIADIMDRIRNQERVDPFETIRIAQDGTHRDVSLSVTPVRDPEGRAIGACSTARDISELKRVVAAQREVNYDLERRVKRRTTELARTNESLLSSNVELQRFAYVASHDLQAPLRTIASYAQFLQEDCNDQLDETARGHITHIVSSATLMQRLIRDLLELSRVEARVSQFAPASLDAAFRRALEMLSGAIENADAEVDCDELPVVPADATQMAQLFQNLIGNAIKYRGDKAPRISVTVEPRDEDWNILVRDNGIGVAQEQQEKIFDVFTRLQTEASYPGTGLGLAICRRIVNRHGGRIWVESEEGNGSTFCFTVPKAAAKVSVAQPEDAEPSILPKG